MKNGGAIHLASDSTVAFNNDSNITLDDNTANQFGGAIYGNLLQETKSKILFDTKEINCNNNTALKSPFGYIDIPTSCYGECLKYSVMGIRNETFHCSQLSFITPPSKLELSNPAMCVDNNNSTICKTYFIKGIMLGQELITDACVRDHYNQPTDGTEFVVTGKDQDHYLDGSKSVLIFCNALKGISVVGNKVAQRSNFSMTITS